MADSLSIKRTEAKLPSIMKHGLAALAVVALLAAATWASVNVFGDADDAVAGSLVAVQAAPLPPLSDSLDGESAALPDLLAGEVAMNENPTETIDALGNPITGATSTPEIIVAPMTNPSPSPAAPSAGPKTILIDGKAIGGGTVSVASSPLQRAPIAGLSQMSPYGPIPAVAPDGRKAVKAYARPFAQTSQKSVSIIVGGLGVNAPTTRRAISELPPEVTLSFAAHSGNLQNWINQARARGHEVLIELPMESAGFDPSEPGADRALRTSDAAQNLRNLDGLLSKAQGYFAVTNYNGDVFLSRSDVVAPVLARLSEVGLGFIFDGSTSAPSLRPLAQSARLPYASGFSLIDSSTDPATINQQLDRLTANAGSATIGVGFAYPQTIDAVKAWAMTLPSDVTLAPASAALR